MTTLGLSLDWHREPPGLRLKRVLLESFSPKEALLGAVAFLLSAAVSGLITLWVVLRLPEDFLVQDRPPLPLPGYAPWVRWLGQLGLNGLGLVVIALGVLMALPGVPGQGLLTILLGMLLLRFPGQRRVVRWLLCRRPIAHAIARVRARYRRPPLRLPVLSED